MAKCPRKRRCKYTVFFRMFAQVCFIFIIFAPSNFEPLIMPKTKKTFKRILILDGLLRSGEYTMENLNSECNKQLNKGKKRGEKKEEVSLRTTQGDIKLMQDEYHVQFKSSNGKRIKCYSYKSPTFSIADQLIPGNTLDQSALRRSIEDLSKTGSDVELGLDPIYQWAIVMMKKIAKGEPVGKQKIIQFDSSPCITGSDLYYKLFCYIANQNPLVVTYEPFDSESREHTVHPYQLREYNRRWYLVGLRVFTKEDHKDPTIYVYPVDRIKNVKRTKINFVEPPVDLDEHFEKAYGITVKDDITPVTVKLEVTPKCYHYIETKPIHSSQTLLQDESTEDYKVLTIELQPNFELEALILSYGESMKVLEPLSLRKRIEERLQRMQERYGKDNSNAASTSNSGLAE